VDRSDKNTQEPFVKRVTLPSGKSIEVLYFGDQAVARPAPVEPAAGQPLHLCTDCSSDLVYPTDWQEAGPADWEVELRCPNCEWSQVGTYDQATVDRFDEQLDHGTEALVKDLRRLVQANMEAEAERFAAALNANAILPEDF
jgi:hypothetical protein